MKLLSFSQQGRTGFGALVSGGIADLSGGEWPDLRTMIARCDIARLQDAVSKAPRILGREDVELLPPIPDPEKIFCVGFAYHGHLKELGRSAPTHPSVFLRLPRSFVGHGSKIVRPIKSTHFDFEAELGVIIGQGGRHIPVDRAMQHVAGYTCVAENSVRDYQAHNAQVTPGKNFDRSGAVGPWLVTADEIPDPLGLHLVGRLNGVVMQETDTADLLFTVAEVIAYISKFTTLEPGDLIATGTPAGVGGLRKPPVFMVSGDRFEVEISGIGVLSNTVADELAPVAPDALGENA